jgi:hypothetical protein
MATFEEVLVHPLFLLLIGAGISGGLVTWLTRWLENRRKELEIKVDIASSLYSKIRHFFQKIIFAHVNLI